MLSTRKILSTAVVAGIILWAAIPAPAFSADIPKFVVIAVNESGGLLNAIGSGLAKLIADKTPMKVRVRKSSGGLDALVNSGDADIGVGVSVESHQSYNGLNHYKGKAQTKMRLISSGPSLIVGFLVRKDAPFATVADLMGRKVGGEYPNTRPLYFDGKALLGAADLSWNDVTVVPVASIGDGIKAFIQGRTEAGLSALGAGLTRQADAKLKGVRFLGLPKGGDVAKKLWAAQPGFYAFPVRKGMSVGVDRDMVLAAKDIYLNANAAISAHAVYLITKTMWNDMKSLHAVHPLFRRWSPRAMITSNATIPFHEGAVRFYKEMGKWSDALEKRRQTLLKGAAS